MAIKTITKAEKAERATVVATDAKSVRCVRTVKPDEESPVRAVVDWTFDLSSVTPTELAELATRTLVIDAQRAWRALADRARMSDAWAKRTIDVREMLDAARTRATADPATQATRAAAKMSETEKQALVAQLQAELAK